MRIYKFKDIDFSENFGIQFFDRINKETQKLRKIYLGEIEYSPGDYPRLLECFEMLYKGTYLKAGELWDNFPVNMREIKAGHHFSPFAMRIDKKIPLSDTREGKENVLSGLEELENLYNDARFGLEMSLEDFRKAYRRFDYQMARMYEGIGKEVTRQAGEEKDCEELECW